MALESLTVSGRRIACLTRPGRGPTLVWLGGLRSEMTATKASRLDAFAARTGRAFVRFDYSGHGQSDGRFEEGTVSRWLEDTLGVIAARAHGRVLLIGSSLGGHLALLAARAFTAQGEGDRLAGLVLIAPALDLTERLIWARLPEEARRAVLEQGVWHRPSAYSPEPLPITRALIEDGRRHSLGAGPIAIPAPIHILHGTADPDVPWSLSVELMGLLTDALVTLTLVKDGDHRLSRPEDLDLIERTVEAMLGAEGAMDAGAGAVPD